MHEKRGGPPLEGASTCLSYDDLHTCLRERAAFYPHSTECLAPQSEMVLQCFASEKDQKSELSSYRMQKE